VSVTADGVPVLLHPRASARRSASAGSCGSRSGVGTRHATADSSPRRFHAAWSPGGSSRGAHDSQVEVIAWTVNEEDEMHRLLDLGVDGLITDHPSRLRRVLVARGEP
jgi:glycerophosphoryl diester phosphodiesterase